jgi:hypothetical protein
MKGIAKIPFLGDLPGMANIINEVEEEIQRIEKTENRIVSKQEAMNMAFKKMKGVVTDSLTDPLVLTGLAFKLILEALQGADKGAGELAKGFNMTYNEAA